MANAENGAWEGISRCLEFPYQWALSVQQLVVPPCQRNCGRRRRFRTGGTGPKLLFVVPFESLNWRDSGRLN